MTTYADIYTKFLIEYDKANITSSYPSLTPYEIATILDKAYLALLSLKITGNNPRRASFEADIKAIEDVRPLVTRLVLDSITENVLLAKNETAWSLNNIGLLYPLDLSVKIKPTASSIEYVRKEAVMISHVHAKMFKQTSVNYPWIKDPVYYIEDDAIRVLIDPKDGFMNSCELTFVKQPIKFVRDDDKILNDATPFELNDVMAEELINLAIIMALETVESPRLNTKTQTSALES